MNEDLTYFSIADRQMEPLTRADSVFVRSLLDNILFYPNALLVPDIYFFISHPLANHILHQGGSDSFLAACVANGLIVPSFRKSANGSFKGALTAINDERIQGVRRDTAIEVMSALHVAANNGTRFRSINWPGEDLGLRFEHELHKQLVRPQMPDAPLGRGQSDLAMIWQDTAKWRMECIETAKAQTALLAGTGIRRGEIMNAVAKDLNYPEDRIDSIEPLLHFVSSDPRKRRALEAFFLWMNLCYHKNHADAFNCSLTFPRFDPIVNAVVSNFLPGSTSYNNYIEMVEIREVVTVPRASLLLRMGPKTILQARLEEGREYFERLVEWQVNPNEARGRALVTALKKYSDRLVVVAARAGTPELDRKLIRHVVSQERNREFMRIALDAATSFVRSVIPKPIAEIVKSANSLISLSSVETDQIEVAHTAKLPAELISHTQR